MYYVLPMLQILMSDLASVQSIHQNLCTNKNNCFINLHINCLHVTYKANFKPFKVNSIYLNVCYLSIFNHVRFYNISRDLLINVWYHIHTLIYIECILGGISLEIVKDSINIKPYFGTIGDIKIYHLSHLYELNIGIITANIN